MEKAYLVTVKTNLDRILKSNSISRIYIWDAECDFNFMYFLEQDFFKDKVLKSNKTLTILTPCTFTEKNINLFKSYLENNKVFLLDNKCEFVVNDWGTMFILKTLNLDKYIVIGPYMYYQKRDSLSYHIIEEQEPDKNDIENLGNISINNSVYKKYLEKFNFKGIEIFNYTILEDIEMLSYPMHLYYPNVVKSITKYCYNNMLYNNKDSLEVVTSCSWCKWKEGKYSYNNYWITWYYSWNKYYYKMYSLKFLKSDTLKPERLIYNFDM